MRYKGSRRVGYQKNGIGIGNDQTSINYDIEGTFARSIWVNTRTVIFHTSFQREAMGDRLHTSSS